MDRQMQVETLLVGQGTVLGLRGLSACIHTHRVQIPLGTVSKLKKDTVAIRFPSEMWGREAILGSA